jgi:hypothetical protein
MTRRGRAEVGFVAHPSEPKNPARLAPPGPPRAEAAEESPTSGGRRRDDRQQTEDHREKAEHGEDPCLQDVDHVAKHVVSGAPPVHERQAIRKTARHEWA